MTSQPASSKTLPSAPVATSRALESKARIRIYVTNDSGSPGDPLLVRLVSTPQGSMSGLSQLLLLALKAIGNEGREKEKEEEKRAGRRDDRGGRGALAS